MKPAWRWLSKSSVVSAAALFLALLMAAVPAVQVAAAPSSWTARRTGLVESHFRDTFFLPASNQGWAVGSPYFNGTDTLNHCWYTPDGGTTWTGQTVGNWLQIPTLIFAEMSAVQFRNANLGYAVGQAGLISKCTNGAAGTWAVVRVGSFEEVLQDVFCPTDTDVWVVGLNATTPGVPSTYTPLLLHSPDAGANWNTLDLSDVSFASKDVGWAVGPGGAIIATTDGGATWALQSGGTTADLNAVQAVSASEAWAAGDAGTILHTLDGGATWNSDLGADGVCMLDTTHVWVAGQDGLVMFYDGSGWTLQNTGYTEDLNAIDFVNANYGWAVGASGRTVYTTNGGANWTALGGVGDNLNDVCVFDDIAGPSGSYLVFTCGNGGALYLTTDTAPGGSPGPWAPPSVTPPPVQDLHGIDFDTATHGWVCGSNGTLAETADAGNTWDNGSAPAGVAFKDVTWTGDTGKWFATAADGGMWQTRLSDTWGKVDLTDTAYSDSDTVYHVGGGGAIIRQDGATWTVQDSTTSADLLSCEFRDTDHGWIGGEGTVLYTHDGGTTWTPDVPVAVADWNDVSVIQDGGIDYICAVGSGGNIVHTTDDGVAPGAWQLPNWSPGGAPDLDAVAFMNKDVGWALGVDGTVWQTLDGSATNPTWKEVHLNDAFALADNNMYFVGDGGTIIHWDGAQTATLQHNAAGWTTDDLNAVYMTSSDDGWAVGDNGTVIECVNGTWGTPTQVGGVNPNLNDIYLMDQDNGYAVGDGGYYVKRATGAWGAPAQVGVVNNPNLNALWLTTATDGWAVGDSGYYTQLAADAWTEPAQVGPPTPDLNSIWLTGADSGYAVGDAGYHVELSAGAWNAPTQVGGDNPNLYDLTYPGSSDGWAVGGNGTNGYRVPINSGVYGTAEMVPGNARDLNAVSFYADGHGVAAGDSRTVVSYNIAPGIGWEVKSGLGATTDDFRGFDVPLSDAHGFGVGTNGLAYRFDGGFIVETDCATTDDLNAVDVPDADEAYVVGANGAASHYTGSWSLLSAGTTADLFGVEFNSTSTGAVVGAGRFVAATTSSGSSWTLESGILQNTRDLMSVDFAGAADGWICGQTGSLYRYEDGRIYALSTSTFQNLEGVGVYDDSGTLNGFCVGDKRIILHDDGGGLTLQSSADTSADLGGASFPNSNHGWFAGSSNTILEFDSGRFLSRNVGTGYDYLDVSMVDAGGGVYTGTAVGTGGQGAWTGDGWTSWSSIQNVGTTEDLNGVEVQSATSALLVGNRGVVRRSTDGGHIWAQVTIPPTTNDLQAVAFADANNAWLVGASGDIFASTDGGDNWLGQTSNTGHDLYGVDAVLDAATYYGWAVGAARTIMATVDGGTNWTARSHLPTPGGLMAADYLNAGNWYVVGFNTTTGGEIAHTTNGGATFTVEATGLPGLYGIDVGDPVNIWAAGDSGAIMYWNGAAWAPQMLGGPDYRDISMTWDGAAYCGTAVGAGVSNATYTLNGGAAWLWSATNNNKNTLYGVHTEFLGGPVYRSVAVGDSGTILLSLDCGNNFGFAKGPANTLNGVSFIDGNNGWACGSQGTILSTGDAGVTWSDMDNATTAAVNAISALDATHVYAVGDGGLILFYDGVNWATMVSGTASDLFGVCALDATHAWAVGESGTILYYNGVAWTDQSPGGDDLNAVGGFDGTHAWAVGDSGTIRFFNGTAWNPQTSGVDADLLGVCAVNQNDAWAVGTGGTIVNTSNGSSWSQQDSGTGADLHGVAFDGSGHPDVRNGWVVGANEHANQEATIKSTTNGGSSWESDTSNTGPTRSLRGLDLAWNAANGNWDAFAVGDWGRVQTLSKTPGLPSITPPLVPAADDEGSPVTINGSGFGADQVTVNGHVYFNPEVEAAIDTWTDTQVVAYVPGGAYGYQKNVHVVNDSGSSPGEPFTVVPRIDGATSPVTGGDTVLVSGEGFGPDPGPGNRSSSDYHVLFAGQWIVDAGVTAWSNTSIQFVVPDDTAPGTSVPIRVASGDTTNESNDLNVEVDPGITGIDPTAGPTGTGITVTGTNFGTNPGGGYDGDNCVRMNRMEDDGNIVADMVPAAHLVSWSATQIKFTVPNDLAFHAWTGPIRVFRNLTQSNSSDPFSVEPEITDFLPTSGNVGVHVTISGSAFWAAGARAAAGGHVYFNGVEVTGFISESYDQLIVEVPECVTGPVRVTTVGGSFASTDFTVIPAISGLSVNQGRVGDAVTITGTGFGPSPGGSVAFNGANAAVTSWSANSITVTVPNAATTGDVVVTTDGPSNGLPFSVLPRITGVSPSSGIPGTTVVTINGFTFGATQGTSTVTFDGTDAGTADTWSASQIKVKVPAGATGGNILVTTPDGVSNGWPFSVGPIITDITPKDGPPDSEVTVTGNNFKDVQGSSKVKFNGVEAGEVIEWTDGRIKVVVPEGAESGDVTVTTGEGTSNAVHFDVGLSHTYYFAEGTTRPNFEEWLCLMNPNASDVTVNITYMKGDGTTKDQQVNVPKTSRTTLFVADAVGPDQDVSAKVECSKPIMAERPMYFNYGGAWTGGHNVVGAIAPREDWYFAEGTTRDGFCEYLCLQNPGTEAAEVAITYMLGTGENKVQTVTIDPTSRETIDVRGFLGPNVDCSAYVHSNRGIVAERPMYFIYKPDSAGWTGGHDVVGATSPRQEWFFAEGTTREGFDEWLCLQNPGTSDALATIVYMLGTGENRTQVVTVPASSRITVDVVTFLGRGQDVSMRVTSDRPIVAERPMYFDYAGLTGGSDVVGATFSAKNWYFAEGATQNGFQEWMSIQNPNPADAVVNITYMLGTGANIEKSVVVKANSRATVDVNSEVGWGQDVSAEVVCSKNIIVERPMYFNYRGVWTGGHDVVGFHY